MATLKDLIKTETLKVGATSCAPSGSVVDLAGILRDGNTEYVLPESGYVSLCAPSPINTWAGLSCNEIASQARSDAADSWVTHHIYGKKGDVVKITVDKVSRIGWVRFVKAIGGGINDTLKRWFATVSEVRYGFA